MKATHERRVRIWALAPGLACAWLASLGGHVGAQELQFGAVEQLATQADAGAAPSSAAAAALATAPAEPSLDQRFAQALLEYERNHWQQAYEELAQLGSAGHPEAARMALQMSRWGLRLYGMRLVASRKEVARWLHVVGCGQLPAAQGCLPTMVAR